VVFPEGGNIIFNQIKREIIGIREWEYLCMRISVFQINISLLNQRH